MSNTTSTLDTNVKATCTVTIKTEPVAITSVTATPETMSIAEGKTGTITAKVAPSNAYPAASVTYMSGDSTIASVSSKGVVTGVKVGQTTITVSATQNGITLTDTVNVAVTEKPDVPTYTLVTSESQLTAGATVVLTSRNNGKIAGALSGSYLSPVDISINSSTTSFEEIPADGDLPF